MPGILTSLSFLFIWVSCASAFISRPGAVRARGDVRCKAGMSPADKLRKLLEGPEILLMPSVYDGLTARLVEMHGFPATFMTGFGVAAVRGECQATNIPQCAWHEVM